MPLTLWQLRILLVLLINLPHLPSSFKAQHKYHCLGKNFPAPGKLNSSLLYWGSCLLPLLHSSTEHCSYLHTCVFVSLLVSEVLEVIHHVLFMWHFQGSTCWQTLSKCLWNECEDLVRNPRTLSILFLQVKWVGQNLRIYFENWSHLNHQLFIPSLYTWVACVCPALW